MVSRKTTIVNEEGFHMRAAADFVKAVSEYQSDIGDFTSTPQKKVAFFPVTVPVLLIALFSSPSSR